MASLAWIERLVGWLGGLAAMLFLCMLFIGIARGMRHAAGRTSGRYPGWLRSPAFYLFASLAYFGLCFILWRPIPLMLPLALRIAALVLGALVYFSGLALALWGRLALGRLYFVSSSLGAQLFADHQLVTRGPYALVRHPIYLGILLTGLGGLLLYRTWTLAFIAFSSLGLVVRARREEVALQAEFGSQWLAYCQRVPPWLPRLRRSKE